MRYGISTTDGENAERFWAKLTPFLGRTQIMTMENRRDFLCLKLEQINSNESSTILASLEASFNRVALVLRESARSVSRPTYVEEVRWLRQEAVEVMVCNHGCHSNYNFTSLLLVIEIFVSRLPVIYPTQILQNRHLAYVHWIGMLR